MSVQPTPIKTLDAKTQVSFLAGGGLRVSSHIAAGRNKRCPRDAPGRGQEAAPSLVSPGPCPTPLFPLLVPICPLSLSWTVSEDGSFSEFCESLQKNH